MTKEDIGLPQERWDQKYGQTVLGLIMHDNCPVTNGIGKKKIEGYPNLWILHINLNKETNKQTK